MELTEFDSEMWSGLYLSLWMFTGKWQIAYDKTENQNVILLQTKFRNRLDRGQYPYPFWHSTAKWNDWQNATALKVHLDPSGERVFAFFRSKSGERVAGNYPDIAPRAFDGQWRWPGADGVLEPRGDALRRPLSQRQSISIGPRTFGPGFCERNAAQYMYRMPCAE